MSEANNATSDQATSANTQPQLDIHKLYLKDFSFETPNDMHNQPADWRPELNVDIHTESKPLQEDNTHEVVLTIKCSVKSGDHVSFVVEAKQAGIVTISNMEDEQTKHALGSYCPNMLYPYLREAVSDIVLKAGFPQLNLAPINFDMLYQQQMEEAQKGTVH